MTAELILSIVCEVFEVSINDLKSISSKQTIVQTRFAASFILYNKLELKLREVGELIGTPTRAGVKYYNQQYLVELDRSATFRNKIKQIENRIYENHSK